MVRRWSRCEAKEPDEVREAEKISHGWDEEVDKADALKGFFACYLLCSLSPRHKGHTYIGFTVNPQRRIKQHNGEKTCGAWRTKRGRPWEMVLCIYGFQSNVSALQFEWAWQHPRESLAVRKAASNFKSLSGVANKIKLAYTMLTLSSWENLKLTVNYFSTKYTRHTAGCPRLPNQMKVNICCMDELPCYAEGQVFGCSNGDEKEDDEEEDINKDAEEINRNISHIRNTPSYILSHYLESAVDNCGHPLQANEPDVLAEHSKPTEEYYGSSLNCSEFDDLSKTPNKVIECRRVSSTSLTPSSCCEDGMELVRQKSSPRSSDNEAMADSSRLVLEVEVINLCTPCCITKTKTKRALFDSEIIDLTDLPMVIQL